MMPPKPLSPDLTGGIQVTPSPLFPSQPLTPPGPLGLLAPGTPPPQLPLAREMPPGLSLSQRLRAYGPGLVGSLVALGGRGPLSRMIGGGVAAGATEKALGGAFTPEALRFGATQGLAETGFGLGRFGKGQVKAKQAFEGAEKEFQDATQAHAKATEQANAAHQAALIQHQADVKQTQTQYRALETQRVQTIAKNQAAHLTSQAEYANKTAGSIVKAWKADVPAFREFPENERGIVDIIAGQGPVRLSEHYDSSMKALIPEARGKEVPLSIAHGDKLGLQPTGVISVEGGKPTHAYYPADLVAENTVGTGRKNPKLYNEVFNALDKLGLGNVQARAEYKAGRGLIEFGEAGDIIKKGYFDPEAARLALFDPNKVGELRSRKEGDVFRGPVAEAVQRPDLRIPTGPLAPPEPPKTPKPMLPPKPLKPAPLKLPEKQETGITKHEIPLGHALGGVGGLLAGHTVGHPYLGFGLGAGIGGAIGPKAPFYRGGPPSLPTSPMLPTTLAEMLRLFLTKPKGTSSQ